MKNYLNTISTTSEAHNYYAEGYKQGKADAIEECTEKFLDELENILHQKDLKLELNQALSIYARYMNKCNDVAEQMKEQRNEMC